MGFRGDFPTQNTGNMLQSNLFENSESEEEYDLKTNSAYARHYDEFRKKEILSHRK